jgi:hypothetical protein
MANSASPAVDFRLIHNPFQYACSFDAPKVAGNTRYANLTTPRDGTAPHIFVDNLLLGKVGQPGWANQWLYMPSHAVDHISFFTTLSKGVIAKARKDTTLAALMDGVSHDDIATYNLPEGRGKRPPSCAHHDDDDDITPGTTWKAG